MPGPWEDYQPQKQAQESGPWEDYGSQNKADSSISGGMRPYIQGAINSLPAIGAVAGGIAGTPLDAVSGPMGNVVGAGMGGYLGEAAKNLINHYWSPDQAPKTTTEAITSPMVAGANAATSQGIGEFAAPYISKAIGKLSQPASEALEDVADQKAIEATGATGKQASDFQPGAGKELRKMGIVKFGNSQGQISKKITGALEDSAENIGGTLKDLDAKGATVDQADIISKLRQRAEALGDDPSQFSVSDQLHRLADRLQTVLESKGGETTIPLSKAEATKRGFQQAANYNSSPLDLSISKEAANVYRQAVEDAATKFDKSSGDVFKQAKKTFGLLSPIEEAAARRAMTLAQSPKGGLLDTAATGAGAVLGGPVGAVVAAPARRVLADRIAPSLSAVAGGAANLLQSAPGAASLTSPALQFGLMNQKSFMPPPPPDYSTVPGKNGR